MTRKDNIYPSKFLLYSNEVLLKKKVITLSKIMIILPRQDSIQMEKTIIQMHLKDKDNSHLHILLKNT